jgi:N-acetyl-anhydromuramyl-L-alanine amidase AmpD
MLLKKGDKGAPVKELQNLLKMHGFYTGAIDGDFGPGTDKAIKAYQKSKGLTVDGIVGKRTYRHLLEGVDTDRAGFDVNATDTDGKVEMLGSYETKEGLNIDKAYLDTDEYVRDYGKVEPINLMIHHTAGWNNPYSTVKSWNKDKRGRVATQYVMGGTSIKKGKYGDDKYNGVVVECFPDNYLGWHTGKVGNFNKVSKLSAGIEICNFGYAEKKGDKYFNYVGVEVPEDMLCDLGYKFRGHQYWHAYTPEQIENLRLLILHIKDIYPEINLAGGLPRLLKEGVHPKDAFEYNENCNYGRELGVWTHTNIRRDKFDCYPDPKLVEMLKNI